MTLNQSESINTITTLNIIDNIISLVSHDIHNWWRKFRLVDNTEDTYTVRWKDPKDREFEDYWKEKLTPWEQLSVCKKKNWKVLIDIANTHSNQLSNHWKKSNEDIANFSYDIIISELSSFDELNPDTLDRISVLIHDFWRKNNPWFANHFILWTQWKELIDLKNWNISKDYIEFIRKNKEAQNLWEAWSYELRDWYWDNIFDATDEQIKWFLIEEITFDLKKDLDKFYESLDVAKNITNNDFSKVIVYKDEIIKSSISYMHEVWRNDRLLDSEWTHLTRWKNPESTDFESEWWDKLDVWDFFSVKMDADWDIKLDIANTSFSMLTKSWQDSSSYSAEMATNLVLDALNNNLELDSNFVIQWWLQLHDFWLTKNPGAKNDFIMWLSWKVLFEVAKWNISEELIEKTRNNESANIRWREYYKINKWITKNIKNANDKQISSFLKNEAIFDLKKDTDVILYAIEYITKEKFPKDNLRKSLEVFSWRWVLWFLSNGDSVVDFRELSQIDNKSLFFNDIDREFKKASDFVVSWTSLNEKWAFCASYNKLNSYSRKKLFELWIVSDEDYKVFESYKKFVKELELFIANYISNYWVENREILDSLIQEMATHSKSFSKIWTTLDCSNIIENWMHGNIPLKKIDRIMEKVLSHWFFDWDFKKVSDIVRWTLEFDNVIDLYNWLEDFMNLDYFKTWSSKVLIKDNIWDPCWEALNSQKYRDINCIIKLHNWSTVELQLQLKPMLKANNKWIKLDKWAVDSLHFTDLEREHVVRIASKIKKPHIRLPKDDFVVWHEIYEIRRSISDKDKGQTELKDKLNRLLMVLHDEAWKQSLYCNKQETSILNINSYEMIIKNELNNLLYPENIEKEFLELAWAKFSKEETQKIIDTITLIKKIHKWQYRDENTQYYTHCVHTALLYLIDWGTYEDMLVCLLHDTVEDWWEWIIIKLEQLYSKEVIEKVIKLSKVVNWKFIHNSEEEYYEDIKKDFSILEYKAYDRLSNLISLYFSGEEYSIKYIAKTRAQIMPHLQKYMPDMVRTYKKVFKFLERHKISENEIKRVNELKQIRELMESISCIK